MIFYLVGLGRVWDISQDLGVSVDTFPERINLGKMQPGCGQQLPPIGGGQGCDDRKWPGVGRCPQCSFSLCFLATHVSALSHTLHSTVH